MDFESALQSIIELLAWAPLKTDDIAEISRISSQYQQRSVDYDPANEDTCSPTDIKFCYF